MDDEKLMRIVQLGVKNYFDEKDERQGIKKLKKAEKKKLKRKDKQKHKSIWVIELKQD